MAGRSRQNTRPILERIGALDSAEQIKQNSPRYMKKAHKDAIRTSVIETMLLKNAKGLLELNASQVKSLEILLDRRKPKLTSVDSTVTMAESWSDTLRRIAEARKPAQSASITPIAAPLSGHNEQDSTEDAA